MSSGWDSYVAGIVLPDHAREFDVSEKRGPLCTSRWAIKNLRHPEPA